MDVQRATGAESPSLHLRRGSQQGDVPDRDCLATWLADRDRCVSPPQYQAGPGANARERARIVAREVRTGSVQNLARGLLLALRQCGPSGAQERCLSPRIQSPRRSLPCGSAIERAAHCTVAAAGAEVRLCCGCEFARRRQSATGQRHLHARLR